MTDTEIVRDLFRCATTNVSFCKECGHRNYSTGCCIQLMKDALDLITRQRTEIEYLKQMRDGAIEGQETLQKYILQKGWQNSDR